MILDMRAKEVIASPPWLLPRRPFMEDTMAEEHDTEEWLPIPGHSDYEASSWGRIRSRPQNHKHGKVLKPSIRKDNGHLRVDLGRGSGQKSRTVDQLVLEAFIGPKPFGCGVRHLDGNPANNSPSNLAWGTQRENVLDTVKHGRHNMARKTHCKRGHEFTAENTSVQKRGNRECRSCRREVYRPRQLLKELLTCE